MSASASHATLVLRGRKLGSLPKPSISGWNFWLLKRNLRSFNVMYQHEYDTYKYMTNPPCSVELNRLYYTKINVLMEKVPKRTHIGDETSFQAARILAMVAFYDEGKFIRILNMLETAKVRAPSADDIIVITYKSRQYSFRSALIRAIKLASNAVNVELRDHDGHVLQTYERGGRYPRRLVICEGYPLFFYRHTGNRYRPYSLLGNNRRKPERHKKPDTQILATMDVRRYVCSSARLSTWEQEIRLTRDRKPTTFDIPTRTAYYLTEHVVLPTQLARVELDMPPLLVQRETRAHSYLRPILRIYGLKYYENELNITNMLAKLIGNLAVSLSHTKVHMMNGYVMPRNSSTKKHGPLPPNLHRAHSLWSTSKSMNKFCSKPNGGSFHWPEYRSKIYWKTFPNNTCYARNVHSNLKILAPTTKPNDTILIAVSNAHMEANSVSLQVVTDERELVVRPGSSFPAGR